MVNMKRAFLYLFLGVPVIFGCKSRSREITPQIKPLTAAVYASGTLVPENEYKVVSFAEGFMERAFVREGDSVRKGQLLFQINNDTRQTQVAVAKDVLKKTLPVTAPDAPSILDLQSRLASAKDRLRNDSLQYVRYHNVFQQQAIAASTYEKYQLQYENSRRDVSSLEEQLRNQHLSAALQLQQARNELQIARTEKYNGMLRSFADGVIYELYRQTGDLVGSSQPIALLGSGPMIARLLVDEDDLGRVRNGQNVLVTMDAYPDRVFHAKVTKIYPLLNKQEQSFRVDAYFQEQVPVKLYGLNIEANIVIKDNEKALVIPRKALGKGDSVLVRIGNETRKIRIKVGAVDQQYAEVLGGLPDSSTIIIMQP
jgi:multidrug efflux pump subunit AcrA (membrane-fusion protein)